MKPISRVGKAKRAPLESFQVGTARRTRLCPPYSPCNVIQREHDDSADARQITLREAAKLLCAPESFLEIHPQVIATVDLATLGQRTSFGAAVNIWNFYAEGRG